MAAVNQSSSGFSYAQAARGQTSQTTPSSKVTSGTATPASIPSSELPSTTSSNWADDAEGIAAEKTADSRKAPSEQSKPSPAKDSAVERTKSESRTQNDGPIISSPDLTASSSTTTQTDESSIAPNGTPASDSTWETKSQTSEPAWIAERKERQSTDRSDDGKGKRGKKETKETKDVKEATEPALPQPPQKPVVYTEAPLPSINPWAKRMEDAKAKPPPPPPPQAPAAAVQSTPKATATATSASVPAENQPAKIDPRKKSLSMPGFTREVDARVGGAGEARKPTSLQGKRTDDTRNGDRPRSKPTSDTAAGAPKATQREHQSLPNSNAVPPPVKDEVSWPTPENAQEKERKESVAPEKETKSSTEEGGDPDSSASKPHQKTKWKPIPVTPNIVWQTEEMNHPRGQHGERGGRGGNSSRGRGGYRGAGHGSKGGDRAMGKTNGSQSDGENGPSAGPRGRSITDRDAMPPPPKPVRDGSASGSRGVHRNGERNLHDRPPPTKPTGSAPNAEAATSIAIPALTTSDARRTKSPSKTDTSGAHGEPDDKVPDSIPRQHETAAAAASALLAASDTREGSEPVRENHAARRTVSDGKKESRAFEGYSGNNKEWNGTPRGGRRNGRGRGGSREYTNGHQANPAFANGPGGEFSFGIPPSPSAYQAQQRNSFAFPQQQGRGGWPRGTPRSQSIPVDNMFNPAANNRSYWPPHLPPVQTSPYFPAMYDYGGMPMSAVPYNQVVDQQYLMDMVSTQLEYYFSLDNLLKDMFLRKNMDSQGFVFLDVIANFNRIKHLTADKNLLKAVCLRSESIEIRVGDDGKDRLRRREGWDQFLLPKEQREAGAQNDGPAVLRRPENPPLEIWPPPQQMAFRGPPSAGAPPSQRRSHDAGYAMNSAPMSFAPFSSLADPSYQESLNGGEEMRGRATKSPIRQSSVSPGQSLTGLPDSKTQEPDVFPNEQASTLTVVVKMNAQRPPYHNAASRTFSNGSIDPRGINGETEKPLKAHSPAATNGEQLANGEGGSRSGSGSAQRHASPGVSRSPDKGNGNSELMLLWVKDKEVPQEGLPQDATLEPYYHLRSKALGQREQAATGTCPYDLDVLYQFWSHFLIRNFNHKMYTEFKYCAHDDAVKRVSGVGLVNLVLFYSKALASSNRIRDHIAKDYVELVKNEPAILRGQATRQLRKAWRDGATNLKNRKTVADLLDEQFKASLDAS